MNKISNSPLRQLFHLALKPHVYFHALVGSQKCRFARLALLLLLLSLVDSQADYQVINDTFTNGLTPMWHFVDANPNGSPWNITTDTSTSPAGIVLANPVIPGNTSYTQAVRQFDLKSLVNVGDYIRFVVDIRTPATQTTGKLSISMLNAPGYLTGNAFGYTPTTGYTTVPDPMAGSTGYTFVQNYNSTTPSIINAANGNTITGTPVSPTAAPGGVVGNTKQYYYAIMLTKVATGIQISAVMGGGVPATTVVDFIDTASTATQFNTLRIDAGGAPAYFDNMGVDTTLPSTTFEFTLPHAYVTSAGVFNSSHQLVRELWKKRSLPAGTYVESWDNLDANGNPVPAGVYTIKVLYHNMSYTWEGVVGDTSSSFTGPHQYVSYQAISYMSIDPTGKNGSMYSSVGYNEGGASIFTASTSDPQTPTYAVQVDQAAPFTYVATDGTNYYFCDGGCSYDTFNNTFVAAIPVGTQTLTNFYSFGTNGTNVETSADQAVNNPYPVDYPSCIDDVNEVGTPSSTKSSIQPANAFPSGTKTITMASSAGLALEAGVTGPGIASGTTIRSYNGSTITLSLATTAAESAENLTINIPIFDKNFVLQHQATGLAVQSASNQDLLAVSHGGLGYVEIFNKTSGAQITTATIGVSSAATTTGGVYTPSATAPGQVAFAPSGDLWVLTGTTAVRYTNMPTPSNPTSVPTVATTISGFSAPLAIAVSPTSSDIVAIADGGTSQQVKFYNHLGALVTTIGQGGSIGTAGGYPLNGPAVTTNKFWFEDMEHKVPMTFLAFQSDGSLWVGDLGNMRCLHFNGSAYTSYVGQIAYLPATYALSVDPNNPSRVFTGNLEYNVSYTTPLTGGDPGNPYDPVSHGNGCWTLVNNWYGGNTNWNVYGEFSNVMTMSNSRTYGLTHHLDTNSNTWVYNVFEFPSTTNTPVRLTTSTPTNVNGNNIEPDGTIRYASPLTPYATSGLYYSQDIYEQAPPTFSSSNDPTWGAPTSVASVYCQEGVTNQYTCAYAQYDPAIGGGRMGARIPKTASNYYVTYQPEGSSYTVAGTTNIATFEPNNHVGVVTPGGTNFLWENSPGGAMGGVPDGEGTFEDTSSGTYQSYGGHCGIAAFANGHNIIEGYDGQYGYYSNQWIHYYDDGLFVGQFGVTVDDYWAKPQRLDTALHPAVQDCPPGLAGNISAGSMVNNNGTNYIYCTDEGYHGGIHRWRLDGTINEISGGVNPASDAWYDLSTPVAWPSTNLVYNPSFECEAATYTLAFGLGYTPNPVGWQVYNNTDGSGAGAFYTEWTEVGGYTATSTFAHSLPYRATIAKSTAYTVAPYQVITGLTNGTTYTFSAWVRSSGGQPQAYIYAKTTPYSTFSASADNAIAITGTGGAWTQVSTTVTPTNGQAEVGFYVQGNGTTASPGEYVDIDDVSLTAQ